MSCPPPGELWSLSAEELDHGRHRGEAGFEDRDVAEAQPTSVGAELAGDLVCRPGGSAKASRLRHYRAAAGSIKPMVRHSEFADQIPKQVGSVLYTAVHTGEDTVLTITMFDDAEAADRAEATVATVQQALMDRFGAGYADLLALIRFVAPSAG
ncbi:hypothetical protein [Flindersiella endophytica]